MKTQKGFGLVPVLLILILLSLVGFTGYYVYNRQSNKKIDSSAAVAGDTISKSSPTPTATPTTKQTTTPTPTPDTNKYTIHNIGISFDYPSDWTIKESDSNNYKEITINSKDIEFTELKIGGMEVSKGASVTIRLNNLDGKSIDQYYNQSFAGKYSNNGLSKISLGKYECLEYEFAYESPLAIYTLIAIGNDKIIDANYASKDLSQTNANFTKYHNILASITQK